MHHPPKKNKKSIRNQHLAGTAFVIGREVLQPPKFKDHRPRDNRHARSLIGKDKFLTKMEDLPFEINPLQVNGRQIGSSLNLEPFKFKTQSRNIITAKLFLEDMSQTVLKVGIRQQKMGDEIVRSSPTKGTSVAQLEGLMKQNSLEDNNVFPELSVKEIALDNNPRIEKKNEQYRTSQHRSDRDGYSMIKMGKRRDTVIDTTSNRREKPNFAEESGKNKQELKKKANLLQFRQFLLTINLTNRLLVPPEDEVLYKAYVCKGNNGLLVKSIFKTRPWWSFRPSNEMDSCNIVWTEWKRNKSMVLLASSQKQTELNTEVINGFTSKVTNKQIKEKQQKKWDVFAKIVGNNTQLFNKFQGSTLSDNYYTCTAKINTKVFDEISSKTFGQCRIERQRQRKMVNHIPGCFYLHSKKLLFLSMKKYYQKLGKDVFTVIPRTFVIAQGTSDPQFNNFVQYFEEIGVKNKKQKKGNSVWICKPGQNSNRGQGIQVVGSMSQIRSLVSRRCGGSRTVIIQKYMQNPFLYNRRKFDIRMFILITCVNGCVKGYWYDDGYVRTTSKQYNLKQLDNRLVHLTNDAVQKKGQQFGKYQSCNKISLQELQRYIEVSTESSFINIMNEMKNISMELISAVSNKINPRGQQYCFQLFGLDFMLDDKLSPFLIEANSNPCLEVDGNILGKVIPRLIENVLRVAIDPIYPPPYSEVVRNKFSPGSSFQNNQMVLVFDSLQNKTLEIRQQQQEGNELECEAFEGEIDQD